MRQLTTDVNNILSLVSCAEDYGFARSVLFDAFSDILGNKLSESEIERYAREVESQDGFGEEDYIEVKERLVEFKEGYITS